MKIFELRGYIDGGPNDRGVALEYFEAPSLDAAKTLKQDTYTSVIEISTDYYYQLKTAAQANLAKFKV